jgi:hypothetical protein
MLPVSQKNERPIPEPEHPVENADLWCRFPVIRQNSGRLGNQQFTRFPHLGSLL